MFIEKLLRVSSAANSALCIGLDPESAKLPHRLRGSKFSLFEFNKAIIDATADLVCAFKPQAAYYAAEAAEDQLSATIEYIRQRHPQIAIILDAKRGDIGPTAEMYAREAFDRYNADAVTVNPYMGADSVAPFLRRQDKGVILLCKTSNPGARTFQDLLVDGKPLYMRVAEEAVRMGRELENVLLVVGATYPEEMSALRLAAGDMTFLVPGIGAQGGSIEAVVKAGQNSQGRGLIVSSSRSIIFASSGEDFAEAARATAIGLRDQINNAFQANVQHRPQTL